MTRKISYGSRVQLGKFKATVRYVGPLVGQTGDWVGLEWDSEDRGKNDGSVAGQTYFHCRYAQKSGSFVRREKFDELVDWGCDFKQALVQQYCSRVVGQENQRSSHRKAAIELVGLDKIEEKHAHLDQLKEVCLNGERISSLGPPGAVGEAVPKTEYMELTDTLLSSWEDIGMLCADLTHLTTLNLSRNRFTSTVQLNFSYNNLKTLVLNECFLRWSQAVSVGACLPSLTELHLCRNKLQCLRKDVYSTENGAPSQNNLSLAFPNLQVLDLDDNQLTDWQDVLLLTQLPSLTHLMLNNNRISEVVYPNTTASTTAAFSRLTCLLLAGNHIQNWDDVNALNHFPALQEVRLTGNPLMPESQRAANRLQVIARISGVRHLNGSDVHPLERRDAELWYLKLIADELQGSPATDAVEQHHPRMKELLMKYNISTLYSTAHQPAQRSLGSSFVKLNITYQDAKVTKAVPGQLSVGKLKLLCVKLMHLGLGQYRWLLMPRGRMAAEDITADDSKQLTLLGVEEAADVIIEDA